MGRRLAMTDFQRKEISYANEVTVMVTADLAGRQGPTCRRTWRWLSRFLMHFLVFPAFYYSRFTDVSKIWHTSSLYAFKKGERKNEVFPYRHSYVPGSNHRSTLTLLQKHTFCLLAFVSFSLYLFWLHGLYFPDILYAHEFFEGGRTMGRE